MYFRRYIDMENANNIVDFAPFLTVLIQIFAAVLLAVGSWAVKKFADRLGLDQDDRMRVYLQDALANAVKYGKQQATTKIAQSGVSKVEIDNQIAADAARYVIESTPDAVKKLKLTEDNIKKLVLARLEQ